MPPYPTYEVSDLRRYLEAVDRDPKIVFYGGEPLLNPKFIIEVMDEIEATYGIQTNATLHHLLPPRYWARFHAVLISVDGPEEFNDSRRGKGTYKKAIELLNKVKGLGVERIIARMAVDAESDIYRDVSHLLQKFPYVHWQLSVDWVDEWDLIGWARSSYLPGIRRLAEEFVKTYEETGEVLGIIPFIAILKAHKEPWEGVPCGAGYSAYSILTDGTITACPIAVKEKWARVGNIFSMEPPKVVKPEVSECNGCKYRSYCGGRCLYWLMERYWGNEGFAKICLVTKRFIETFLEVVGPLIDKMSSEKVVLEYDPTKDSTEAIP
ncbi:radical SAM protein [Ignicoccus islandicus DSM 13165]|uniref:Radical SAM protein n=2 Tax=Ignicoccus islandicus TaxID=54259 RepID=A0A0U2U5J2_9CREN|nr:radical SAM protein [Ignicoccus islandicus DSM 13165]